MNKQQKILLILFVLAMIILMFFILKFKSNTIQNMDASPTPVVTEIEKPTNFDPTITTTQKPENSEEIAGPIAKLTSSVITITKPGGSTDVKFDLNSTPVYKGKNKVKGSPLDLKAGVNVSILVSKDTKTAIEIVVQ
jgi:hypothetical protein